MRAYLVPTADPPVPQPDGTLWPAAGLEVEVDHYVRRRIAEGDLVAGAPPQETGEPATAPEAEAPASNTTDPGARRRKPREG